MSTMKVNRRTSGPAKTGPAGPAPTPILRVYNLLMCLLLAKHLTLQDSSKLMFHKQSFQPHKIFMRVTCKYGGLIVVFLGIWEQD